jgi:DNA polymerase
MKQSQALEILGQKIAKCELCAELTEYRKAHNYLTVPGEGMPNARIMILGEAPGENEAKQGRPFVGKAGNLLTKIIEKCGWTREAVYICNILKCRPPGNRDPLPDEAANCRKFLDLQVRIIDPEWILCFGRIASVFLLGRGPDTKIGSLRGEIHTYQDKKVICTYHPSYLLRNPAAKADVWEDLQPVVKACQTSIPQEPVA